MKSLLLFALLISISAYSKSGPPAGGAKRGGMGFIFEDFNGFLNPAQKAQFRGFATELAYETTINTGNKTVSPSMVWGKSSFGIGGFVSRSGDELGSTSNSTDTIGGAFGLGMAANRITMGAGYARSVDVGQNSDGVLTASINLNGLAGNGLHLGVGASTTMNRAVRDIKSGTVGVGWGFGRIAWEIDYSIEDFVDPNNTFEAKTFFTWEADTLYLGLGFGYEKPVNAAFGASRLGLKIGKFDISIYGNKSFASGSNALIGTALRLKF